MNASTPRFRRYLQASPRSLRAEMDAIGLTWRTMADRWFDEGDVARVCTSLLGASPRELEWGKRVGTGSVEDYVSEFDESRGPFGTRWDWRFWDADSTSWGDLPTSRGLQCVELAFWEEPSIGRDGAGSGSRAVRIYDSAADWIVVFSVGTHQRRVWTAGDGITRIDAQLVAILGT